MNIIRYSIQSFFTNEYYSIIRFASKRLFVATLDDTTNDVDTNDVDTNLDNGVSLPSLQRSVLSKPIATIFVESDRTHP